MSIGDVPRSEVGGGYARRTTSVPEAVAVGLMCPGCRKTTVEHMSTVHLTAPPPPAPPPRAHPTPDPLPPPAPAGATAADRPRRRRPFSTAVRNTGILLDTAARVVFLGRDGVKL